MADTDEVRKVILELIRAEGLMPADERSLHTDGLTLSSLELVRLLVGLEGRLDLEFDDASVMNAQFNNLDDIVALVGRSS